MGVAVGSTVGAYEIVARIGAGAMGEVYRARDPRLGRDVAVKVLPAKVSDVPDRVRRFEQEARAAGALNHPNVAAVYDIGTHEASPYIVSELLTGETLRERMEGASLPPRKALDYAVQIARGLAAAHDKGVVHRDIKPENLFVTRDGQVKILDFGLAKLAGRDPSFRPTAEASALSGLETETGTVPGTVMGTVGYMSPEQVQGLPADHRSDIFSLGAVAFEMLTGRRAFKAPTAVETMAAILKEDPLQGSIGSAPALGLAPGLERILRHCLEKSPEERFQSARDVAFDLETLSIGEATGSGMTAVLPLPKRRRLAVTLASSVIAASGLGVLAGQWLGEAPQASFRQLTFRLGNISSARFSPDSQTIVYSAAWENSPWELFSTRAAGGGTLPLGHQAARILSISASGELAILLLPPGATVGGTGASFGYKSPGTLARLPAGGVPREVLDEVLDADWAPDSQSLAVARWVEGKCRLEFPIGKLLYESEKAILTVRVSPDGQRVAFLEALATHGDLTTSFMVGVVDQAGSHKELRRAWTVTGMTWSPSGNEVWFTSLDERGGTDLRAVTLGGGERLVGRFPGLTGFADVSRDGRVLILDDNGRHFIFARGPGEASERNLSWHNDSTVTDLSADGRTLLLSGGTFGGGKEWGVFLRKTDGSPAVRLGDGYGYDLSPDGRWVLTFRVSGTRLEFVLLPTRAGEPIRIADGLPAAFHGASWLPDSRSFVFSGSQPGEGSRLYLQGIDGGKPRPITAPEDDLRAPCVSNDGRLAAALDSNGAVALSALDGSPARPIAGAEEGEVPIQWSDDGRGLYVYRPDQLPVRVFEVDVATGRRRLWKEITIADPHTFDGHVVVAMTPDGRSYAYSFWRGMAELYLAEGLK